jgi:hypothetical protein
VRLRLILFALIALLAACGDPQVKSKPLLSPNPTAYTFDASVDQVHDAIRRMYEQQFTERSGYSFSPVFAGDDTGLEDIAAILAEPANRNDVYLSYMHSPMGISAVYTVGGKPVPYLADFHLHITAGGPEKTRVEARALRPEVIAGKTLLPRNHMTRANIYLPVEPTTVEEYSFLLKIGKNLRQTGMAPLIIPSQ